MKAAFAVPRRQKQPKYPSADEWISKMWCIHTIKEWNSNIGSYMNKPIRHSDKWNKPDTTGQRSYGPTHLKYLELVNSQWYKGE